MLTKIVIGSTTSAMYTTHCRLPVSTVLSMRSKKFYNKRLQLTIGARFSKTKKSQESV